MVWLTVAASTRWAATLIGRPVSITVIEAAQQLRRGSPKAPWRPPPSITPATPAHGVADTESSMGGSVTDVKWAMNDCARSKQAQQVPRVTAK